MYPIELKPCPFCGGIAKVFCNGAVRVTCTQCHCQTMPRTDDCYADFDKRNALNECVEDWNRRI